MHKIASSDECILWHVHGMYRPFVYAGPTYKVEIILNKRKREIEMDLELPHEPYHTHMFSTIDTCRQPTTTCNPGNIHLPHRLNHAEMWLEGTIPLSLPLGLLTTPLGQG